MQPSWLLRHPAEDTAEPHIAERTFAHQFLKISPVRQPLETRFVAVFLRNDDLFRVLAEKIESVGRVGRRDHLHRAHASHRTKPGNSVVKCVAHLTQHSRVNPAVDLLDTHHGRRCRIEGQHQYAQQIKHALRKIVRCHRDSVLPIRNARLTRPPSSSFNTMPVNSGNSRTNSASNRA